MLKLAGVMLNSADPGKLADFYKKVFGEPVWTGGEFTGFDAGVAGIMVGPHDKVKGENPDPARIIYNLSTSDVQAEFDRIKGLGAEVVKEPYNPGEEPTMMLATFADPDGNYFQLATPMEM
jgi:predicted enzyme related to lactoylglutathione lyase